jgi:hypothetical protein
MYDTLEQTIHCPYCDESINVLVDLSVPEQEYVEDCQVCCRPIVLSVAVIGDSDAQVSARPENE